jgi:hypothetical protein
LWAGLGTGMVLGNDFSKISVKPLFKLALMFTIFCKPSKCRCSPAFISSTADLNNKKSIRFLVSKGYFSKWGIIALTKCLID